MGVLYKSRQVKIKNDSAFHFTDEPPKRFEAEMNFQVTSILFLSPFLFLFSEISLKFMQHSCT